MKIRQDKLDRDEKNREILRLSIEASRRGYMFPLPAVIGLNEDEWIRAATDALARIDEQAQNPAS